MIDYISHLLLVIYMKVTFFGAAHEVTGSCHLIETNSEKILFDCGMFQGGQFNEEKNHEDFGFDPASLDAVVVSHAHLDHTGRIPKLVRDGYRGPIYGTDGTLELAALIWKDAYHIMKYNNKKTGEPVLYTEEDVQKAMSQCHAQSYRKSFTIGSATVVLKDAGHIFGSSFIELTADGKTIGFSGDMGNENVPILQDSESLSPVDLLICESTYGDRVHEDKKMRKDILLDLVKEGVVRGGTIMMPAFSLERTQEILYMLDEMAEEDNTLPRFPIFLDSPLAIDALPTYTKYTEYYDKEAKEKHMEGNDFFKFKQLTITRTVEESKAINTAPTPKMIIAGSGMMNGGRIMHHAMRYLSDPKSTLIIVGYQAQGTLGRKLYEGAPHVRIFHEDIAVHCTIKAIGALSAHGDQNKMLDWIGSSGTAPKKICFVHGEEPAATALAQKTQERYGVETFVPEFGESVEVK
ncbi:MAG: MBL fold metallo-hydrolase [Candidatus Magasanikbacteria bacterium CG_4_9_14_0_2_um_filter_41_10]|uniref:MBL fold metallo-hydrolase n=1 Tax=Candidatus Magasanikbacteria bacterium CG_4_10_14_0_2_um_filter_41_31 TaxID=1974639 RepID=A0A2M7V3B7_9BACT|nr:MAG: MBL fold metallo-hydrolase [Candidatus Magasanikbacteria bacterium CG_4_10_14_0_2_um_filter_41_31]PJC53178.1 MAG: MBL fold metallo-hydrolase [Candidatus Magasanikbacteria bacterium CG_4_9_14_0_2_um_filter_41_10]